MQTLIAQTQENKFMYSIIIHRVCYLNWMSFEQSVRPQSQISSVLLKQWLDDNVSDNDFSLSNYQLFRLDRNRHGGSIAVFVHFSFSCKVLLQGGPFALEFISVVSQPSFSLCLFYRPPPFPVSFFDNLCTTLQIVNPADFSSFLLTGNFNVNFCNTDNFLFTHVQIMLSFSLTQVTHISVHQVLHHFLT